MLFDVDVENQLVYKEKRPKYIGAPNLNRELMKHINVTKEEQSTKWEVTNKPNIKKKNNIWKSYI